VLERIYRPLLDHLQQITDSGTVSGQQADGSPVSADSGMEGRSHDGPTARPSARAVLSLQYLGQLKPFVDPW